MSYEYPDVYDREAVPEVVTTYDSPEVLLLMLQLLAGRGAGPRTLMRVLADMESFLPRELRAFPDDVLKERYGMRPEAIKSVRESPTKGVDVLEDLTRQDIDVLVAGSRKYPTQLLSTLDAGAPPVLFAKGDLTILESGGVGFCGSRHASETALAAVSSCASDLARQNFNVISGYAHGVDMAAHRSALAASGTTTVVLAEGIRRYRKKTELRDFPDANILVLSEFPIDAAWSVGNAMTRNKTICSLADAMVVVESQLEGGTFAAGQAALELGRPLYVIDYGDKSAPGNRYFLEHGAKPLRRRRDGSPSIARLVNDTRRQAHKDDRRNRETQNRVSRLITVQATGNGKRPRARAALFED